MVALKVLDEEHRDRHSTARLAREFRIVEQLTHPHVVRVYDHGAYWLAMQYVDGGNAAHLPSLEIRLQALAQVAEARCTQMVNPKYTYICKISKEILAAYR